MIELDRVCKRYGAVPVVDDVSLTVAAGEFCVLLGPSGSGKSTMLRLINRLIPYSSGAIRIDGAEIGSLDPQALRRSIGYVIQSIGLFPHWTVARNISAVPELLGWPRSRIGERVDELLALLQLDPAAVRGKYPHQLSGGQQQRIGVARALAARPRLLLMDEPFGALDPISRAALQAEIARIHRETGTTILFVTHDIDEALALASRIAVLDRGRLVQTGTPLELLTRPANGVVRDLVGGAEAGLHRLAVATVASRLRAGERAAGEPIAAGASLRQALARMIERGCDRLPVHDAAGAPAGVIHLADLVRQ